MQYNIDSTVRWAIDIPASAVRDARHRLDPAIGIVAQDEPASAGTWSSNMDSAALACAARYALRRVSERFLYRDVVEFVVEAIGAEAFTDNLDLVGARR